MRKVCNALLVIILIAIVIVVALIIVKYAGNKANEQELEKVIETMSKEVMQEELEEMQVEYKGYKVVGTIKIPKINLEYPILEITTNETMKLSITKFWGNGVNKVGNLSLAGHNNYDGTMFGKNKQLEIGDTLELTDMMGVTKNYIIYDKFITDPNDISIIEADEFGTREVTLITCSNGNKERLILKAREGIAQK